MNRLSFVLPLLALSLCGLLAIAGCEPSAHVGNPANRDAGQSDVGELDAGEAGEPDAGEAIDSGETTDAGEAIDSGETTDAGEPDAGTGEADAGECAPPAGGEQGPSGYPLDGWNWEKQGLLFEDASATATNGLQAPALVEAGGRLHLFFAKKNGLEQTLLHAESADGLEWSAPQPVSGLGGGTVVTSPSVVHDGTKFRMWFSSGGIDLAESEDGDAWTVVATDVLGAGEAGAFDAVSILYPSVVQTPEGWALYYSGYNGSTYAIGRAVSADGVTWTRPSPLPVLQRGAAGRFDNAAVAQPRVVRTSTGYLMWYGGYDTSLTNPGPWRVGLAESSDGVTWTRRGVSLDLAASGSDAYSTRDPAPLLFGGGWRMAYVGMGTDYRYRLLWATSDACVR